jgi:multiple sugar transport system substrate-binding protein
MVVHDPSSASGLSRRGFLGLAAGAASIPLLAACGSGGSSGGGSNVIKFWDMPWGNTQYNVVAKKLVTDYKPASGLPSATYQEIQWNNFTQTFSSAVASKTGPAVSSGGGFQAFQFAEQGAIHYADAVVAAFQKDGTFDDFLPGLLDPFKTPKGYAAIPWQQDVRVFWMNKALLDQAGAKVPTTWNEWMTAAAALKKIGVYGYSAGSGAGNNIGNQALMALMINNGGGLWDEDGKLDCTFPRNVEAVDFVIQMVKEGFVDPAAVSYTSDNQNSQWKNKKFAIGIETGGLDNNVGDTSGNLQVMSPPAALHGDKGALVYLNNIMMYTESPSQKGSEAFMQYYFKNMNAYWKQPLGTGLPAMKSIVNLPEFQSKPNSVKIVNEYQPVFKTMASRGTTLSANLARIDSSAPLFQFAQSVLGGKTDGKTALSTLQTALSALVK